MSTPPRISRLLAVAAGLGFLLLASCAPGTDGILITSAEAPAETGPVWPHNTIRVELPRIPVVTLPDLSAVGDYDELLHERLDNLPLQPIDGVEVVTADCAEGERVYSGDETSDVFTGDTASSRESFSFRIDPADNSSIFTGQGTNREMVLRTNGDGSGTFIDEGRRRKLSIEAFADGSGRYYNDTGSMITTVEVDGDGSGVFYRESDDALMTITLGNDGSGALFSETEQDLVTIDAKRDGSGDMYFAHDGRTVTLRVRPDGSWEYSDDTFAQEIGVTVKADGSGQYRERGAANITLDFDTDGTTQGPKIVLPPTPQFAVADRFPELGTLASIDPPCATILRFDTALLFAVNEHELLPSAQALLVDVAPALSEAGRSIEINGHTDATGSEEYNLALSQQRADSVTAELLKLGVSVEMEVNGFGESQPVAANFREDGSDDEAGQRQNRRVEIVIHG